ncbi:E3 ubiquitin-protein ligase CHIP-like [Phalaenopsis equestris]|uniref:E3 ubiquitin-protein ligase CHIP-like n=1 Tax=Phalaenopsis equestris TaxID=78828 RepID=UPI0009E4FC10|nr:E3 ubiquitin-protein ligase CHIP-like [Phalaenopsis equestris]
MVSRNFHRISEDKNDDTYSNFLYRTAHTKSAQPRFSVEGETQRSIEEVGRPKRRHGTGACERHHAGGAVETRWKERLDAAIDAYTEAITLCPDVVVYWTNRALCYYKMKNWTRVEEDCRTAIKLDSSSVKAHYMLGITILERGDYTGGIKELEKAFELGRAAKPPGCLAEDIWQELAKWKYKEWELLSSKRTWQLQTLKDTCEKALLEHHFLDGHQSEDEIKEVSKDVVDQLEMLKEVFNKAAEDDVLKEVPDYLCCKITLEIFWDPVITPSGITYERRALLDHLQKMGKFDPITREPLSSHQLIPNLAIKEAVRGYLEKHGWAYRMS